MNLGTLKVKLGANTKEFDGAMRNSTNQVAAFNKRVKMAKKAGAALGAALSAVGVTLVAKFAASHFKAIDASAKLAQSLRTTTGSIQTLERAGELAGVSMQGIEQATKDLTRRLSQAAGGAGPAAEALDRLNLSAQQLANMPLDQRVSTINQAIRDFIPAAEQAAVAGQLFGEEGSIAMSRLDPDVIRTAAEQAEAFGLAVSDIDASTIERANDSMSGIRNVIDGVWRRIATKLAPIVEDLAGRFMAVAMETKGFQSTLNTAMSIGGRAIGGLADGLRGLQVLFMSLQAVNESLKAAFISVASTGLRVFSDMFTTVSDRVQNLAQTLNAIPGVDIDLSGLDTASGSINALSAEFQTLSDEAFGGAEAAWLSVREKLMEEMPSEAMRRYFEEVTAASAAASAQIIADRQAAMGISEDGEVGPNQEELDAMRESQIKQLEMLRESLLSQKEAEIENHQERLELLRQAMENRLMTEQEINELMEREEQRHRDKLAEIAGDGAKRLADETLRQGERELRERQRQMGALQSGVSNILGAMASENKAFGIAQAIVNTWRGVSESLAAYPWPVSGVMAAASLAAGLQTVRNIQSSSGKGGSSGSSGAISSGGVAASSMQTTSQQPQSEGRGERNATVMIQGDSFSREGVMNLAEQLKELSEDGYQFTVA